MPMFDSERVETFEKYIEYAQSGELQGAVDNLGPITYNPYYRKDLIVANAVATFMGPVLKSAQESFYNDEIHFSPSQIQTGSSYVDSIIRTDEALEYADLAKYIYRNEPANNEAPKYSLTKKGLETEPIDLVVADTTGCLGSLGCIAIPCISLFTGLGVYESLSNSNDALLSMVLSVPVSVLCHSGLRSLWNDAYELRNSHIAYLAYRDRGTQE